MAMMASAANIWPIVWLEAFTGIDILCSTLVIRATLCAYWMELLHKRRSG